jgi:hypothetical protein
MKVRGYLGTMKTDLRVDDIVTRIRVVAVSEVDGPPMRAQDLGDNM